MNKLNNNKIFRLFIRIIIVLIIINIGYYFITIYNINKSYCKLYANKDEISLRKFPYPYKAALSICNDIDNTSTAEEFLKIQEFLNTKNKTEMGKGIGLEIGNNFFMFDSTERDDFSYFSSKPYDKIVIRKFIRAGYIDCFHSFGEGYKDRSHAQIALNEFKKYNFKIKVWVNHSHARSNLGSWFSTNLGDNINSKYYHADMTIPYGIKFMWSGSTTNIIGQAVPITLNTLTRSFDTNYFLKSTGNVLKAFLKHLLSVFGLYKSKYILHANNDLVKEFTLDDGQKVYEFMRYDAHPDGIGKGANSKGLAYNLSKRVLNELKNVNGYAILYMHFGKNRDCSDVIAKDSQDALRYFENQYRTGEIYVTTTFKLLNYYLNHKYLKWSHKIDKNEITITIHTVDDPVFGKFVPTVEDLQGITFYIPSGKSARIFIKNEEIKNINKNTADETNRESVTIPFTYLEYPDLTLPE